MQEAIRLHEEHFSQVLSVLISAYADDPIYQALLHKEKPDFERRLRATLRELLIRHLSEDDPIFGVFDQQGELIACAALTAQSLKSEVSGSWLWRLKMLTTAGIGATSEFLQYIEQVDAYIPNYPHRLLTLFAVEQGHQQLGCGKYLMNYLIEYCQEDKASSSLYVVSDELNHNFFEKLDPQLVKNFVVANVHAKLIKFITEAY